MSSTYLRPSADNDCPEQSKCAMETKATVKAELRCSSVSHNFFWMSVGRFVFGICQWFMLVTLAKLAAPEVVGQYGLAVSICLPVMLLSIMNLRSVLATDAHRQDVFRHYVMLTAVCTIAGMGTILGLGVWAGNANQLIWVLCAVGLAFATESFSEIAYGLFQQREQMDRIGKSLMLRGVASSGAFVTAFAVSFSLLHAVAAAALASTATLVLYDLPRARRVLQTSYPADAGHDTSSRGREPLLGPLKLARLALPLAVVTAIISLNSNIPRYFVELHLGGRELGVFTAIASVMALGNVLVGGLCQAAIPRLARYAAQRDVAAFRKLVAAMAGISLAVGAAGILAAILVGDETLHWLFTAEYVSRGPVFVLLMIAAAIQYLGNVFGAAVISMRRFMLPLPVHLICLSAVFAGSALLIKDYGLTAAALLLIVNALIPTVIFACATLSSRSHNIWHGSEPSVSLLRS